MTKLDFSSGKIQHFNEKQSPTNDYATDGNINNKKQPKNHFQHFFTKLGFNQKQDGIVPYIDSISIDMNWSFMLKVAAVQVSMSIVWIICSIIPMVLVNSINFSHLSLPIYVLLCAFLGLIAARRQSYPYAIAYCIMCAIQSMIHISIVFAFIVLFFKLLDYQSYNFIHDSISNADLIFRLGRIFCVIAITFTGILGLIECCRGFGRLLHKHEKTILILADAHDARQTNPV